MTGSMSWRRDEGRDAHRSGGVAAAFPASPCSPLAPPVFTRGSIRPRRFSIASILHRRSLSLKRWRRCRPPFSSGCRPCRQPEAGSSRRALPISCGRSSVLCSDFAFFRQRFEDGHPNGDPHLDLFGDQRAGLVVGDAARFRPAVHRSGCIQMRRGCATSLSSSRPQKWKNSRAGEVAPSMRSCCRRSIITTSQPLSPSRMSVKTVHPQS